MRFLIYSVATGEVLRIGNVPSAEEVSIQAQDGETAVADPPSDVVADGRWRWTGSAYEQDAIPAPTLAELKTTKLDELAAYVRPKMDLWAEADGGPVGGLQVDDNSASDLNVWATKALICKLSGSAFDLPYWIMADNSHHTFTDADDYLAFAGAAGDYKTACVLNNRALKDLINAAGDEAALDAIDITEGWPS